MILSNSLSNRIANVGFVCACLVVFIHIPQEIHGGSTAYWWNLRLMDGFEMLAVPSFFLISGFFVAHGLTRMSGWELIKKRVKTLLIPFIVLNFLVCLLAYGELALGMDIGFSHRLKTISLESFCRAFGFGRTRSPILGVLWYVRCLFFFVCLAPVINRLIRRGRSWALGWLTVLLGANIALIIITPHIKLLQWPWGYWFSPTGFLWFCCGIVLAHYPIMKIRKLFSILVLIPPLGLALFTMFGTSAILESVVSQFVLLPMGMLGLFALMPVKRFPVVLIRNSFGVYVLHTIVLHFVWLTLPRTVDFYTISSYWLLGFAGVIVSTAISESIHRFCPSLVPYLFGGR